MLPLPISHQLNKGILRKKEAFDFELKFLEWNYRGFVTTTIINNQINNQ